jgi:hypothetical protein
VNVTANEPGAAPGQRKAGQSTIEALSTREIPMNCRSLRGTLLVPFLLMPGVVLADTDWKTYPGTSCQAGQRRQSIDYDAFGGICNTSTQQNVVVHCPIVRDYSQSQFPIFVRHSGRSGNPDVPLRCTLRNMRRGATNSGSAMEAQDVALAEIPSGTSTTIRNRDTNLIDVALDAEDWGAHVLTCDLPRSMFVSNGQQVLSCLYNFSIREWDGQ